MSLRPSVSFSWTPEKFKGFGDVCKPIARVSLQSSNGEWLTFVARVDTGTVISVFGEDVCQALGFEMTEGNKRFLVGISGDAVPCYEHILRMKIGEVAFETKVVFIPAPSPSQDDVEVNEPILGRIGVFDTFEITLRGRTLDTSFVKEV